jgi:DNA (cytosine-5)-methyltransferase 1
VAVCPTLNCNHEVPIATYDMRGNGDGVTVGCLTGDHAGRPTDYTPVVAIQERACAPDLNCGPGGKGFKEDGTAYTLDTMATQGVVIGFGAQMSTPQTDVNLMQTLQAKNPMAVAFERRFVRTSGGQPSIELNPCLRAGTNTGDGAPCVAIADVIHGDKVCNGKGWNDDGTAYTLDTMATQGVALSGDVACYDYLGTQGGGIEEGISPTLKKKDGVATVVNALQVRRLTPRECERLQALPDDWAKIPWRGKPIEECPDGPRYKAIGNGQTVTVMEWLARRIMAEMTR